MPCPFQIFSQSDYLIQIVDINSHTEGQIVQIQISWLLRSQLIWIYAVCKGRVYQGSAGQGLSANHNCSRHFDFVCIYIFFFFKNFYGLCEKKNNSVISFIYFKCYCNTPGLHSQCKICSLFSKTNHMKHNMQYKEQPLLTVRFTSFCIG